MAYLRGGDGVGTPGDWGLMDPPTTPWMDWVECLMAQHDAEVDAVDRERTTIREVWW